jgi:hypothetical protein
MRTHAIAPTLPDLDRVEAWFRWLAVEWTDATGARVLIGDRPHREIDDRCWPTELKPGESTRSPLYAALVSGRKAKTAHKETHKEK